MMSTFLLTLVLISLSASILAAPGTEEFSIHLITTDTSAVDDMDLLPLAGSWEHMHAKKTAEKEEQKWFLQPNLSEEGSLLFFIYFGFFHQIAQFSRKTNANGTCHRNIFKRRKERVSSGTKFIERMKRFENSLISSYYHLLAEAARLGSIEAQTVVAMEYLHGEHLARNVSGAKELFESLNSLGHPLGQMVILAKKVTPTYSKDIFRGSVLYTVPVWASENQISRLLYCTTRSQRWVATVLHKWLSATGIFKGST